MSQKFIDATGKTIDLAVENGLAQLKLDRDNVSIEILEKPKSGFFGIGSAPAKVRISYEVSRIERVRYFTEELLNLMKLEATVDVHDMENGHISVTLAGGDMGLVIGRRGENLDSMQYITNLAVNRGEEEHVRVSIDTENYRAKREESLIRLAKRVAEKVVRYRKNVTLEPMAPNERRIIHASLQDYPGITTYSTGVDPNRRVVVALADGAPRPAAAAPARPRVPRQSAPKPAPTSAPSAPKPAPTSAPSAPKPAPTSAPSAPRPATAQSNRPRRRPQRPDAIDAAPADPGNTIRTADETNIYRKD